MIASLNTIALSFILIDFLQRIVDNTRASFFYDRDETFFFSSFSFNEETATSRIGVLLLTLSPFRSKSPVIRHG